MAIASGGLRGQESGRAAREDQARLGEAARQRDGLGHALGGLVEPRQLARRIGSRILRAAEHDDAGDGTAAGQVRPSKPVLERHDQRVAQRRQPADEQCRKRRRSATGARACTSSCRTARPLRPRRWRSARRAAPETKQPWPRRRTSRLRGFRPPLQHPVHGLEADARRRLDLPQNRAGEQAAERLELLEAAAARVLRHDAKAVLAVEDARHAQSARATSAPGPARA